jgi:hypothetical protein
MKIEPKLSLQEGNVLRAFEDKQSGGNFYIGYSD